MLVRFVRIACDCDDIDALTAAQRIGDKMRFAAEPEPHPRPAEFTRQFADADHAAPGDVAGEPRLYVLQCPAAHRRPHAVGADQCGDLFIRASAAAPLHDGNALGVNCEVFKLGAEPQFDVGLLPNPCRQRRLQIGTMDDPVGRAITKSHRIANRDPDYLVATASD